MPDAPRILVAGVDSSTQSTKVVVCDAATGEIVRSGRAPHPDGTSVHPDRWWDAFTTATADGLLDDVAAISVGGQQHGMCALDESGEVIRDALLWNDTRSAQAARDLTAELGGPQEWVRRTGSALVPSFTVTKVRWLAEHEPENAARVHDVVLPHDWLTAQVLKQGNGFEHYTTDRGDASGTGYFPARTTPTSPTSRSSPSDGSSACPRCSDPTRWPGIPPAGWWSGRARATTR